MGERRMFHSTVVGSDAFMDLPVGVQALYFHLGMQADDDGFVNNPRQVARRLRRPYREVQMLVDGGFLYDFDGIVVVRHWLVANTLRADRMKELQCPELAKRLYITRNKQYVLEPQGVCKNLAVWRMEKMSDICPPKVRQEKIREENIKEENVTQESVSDDDLLVEPPDEVILIGGTLGRGVVRMTNRQMGDLLDRLGLDGFDHYVSRLADYIIEKNANVSNHYATILKWWTEDKELKK